jgi:preprotein translocase subunit YajC
MMKLSLLFPAATVFAQDAAPTPQSGITSTLIMIGIALVFFYFILWRPEQKRRKASELMRSSLKKGDKVTAMGIVGKIDRIQEHTVVIRMIDGAKIEMLKGAITDVQPGTEEESKAHATTESSS